VAYGSTNPVFQSSVQYDSVWQLPAVMQDAEGNRMEIVYTNGAPAVQKAFYSDTVSYDTHYSYTTNGLIAAVTNANEHGTFYAYDADGNLSTIAQALGPVVSNTYDALGFVNTTEILSETGASSGRATQYAHDSKGRVTQITYADGLTASNRYNALDYLMETVDRAGRVTEYTYAPTRELTSVTRYLEQNGSNVSVQILYDQDQQMNLLRITEPRGRYVESYVLDIQDRVTTVTNIEGQTMSFDYSVDSFVTNQVRFDGSRIRTEYDNAGRTASTAYLSPSDSLLAAVYRTYYADSRLRTVSDGFSAVSNTYDRLNRLTEVRSWRSDVSFADSTLRYGYDAVGNVTNSVVSIDNLQSEIGNAYTYDAAERLTGIFATEDTETQSFVYDYSPVNGRMASLTNVESGIVTSWGYDIMDRVTNLSYRTASGTLIRSLNYQYDALGMITHAVTRDGSSQLSVKSYQYDSLNRLTSETRSTSHLPPSTVSYSYDLAGNRLAKSVDGIDVAYGTIGNGNRLDSWSAASSNGFANVYQVEVSGTSSEAIGTNDLFGALYISNRTAQVSAVPDVSGNSFRADDFPLAPGTQEVIAAIRDEAGNMGYASKEVTASVVTNAGFSYTLAGCTTNITYSGTGGYESSLALSWDERYRLQEIVTTKNTNHTKRVEYEYDVSGRRISAETYEWDEAQSLWSKVESLQFIYNGNQIVADLDDSGNLLRSYTWGPGIDNLLAVTLQPAVTNSTDLTISTPLTLYPLKNHQNSVIAWVDENGDIVESYEYDAWGRVLGIYDANNQQLSNSQLGNRYLFQGREYDSSTGLYYFRSRWYDPITGRWLSKDPIGISGGLNLYAFCGNNPVNFVDPMGLCEENKYDPGWGTVFLSVNLVGQNTIGNWFGAYGKVGVGIAAAIIATVEAMLDDNSTGQSFGDVVNEGIENMDNYDYWYDGITGDSGGDW
jgi:RHS repeat-associated protein